MDNDAYDPRYLAGIVCFNARDFFEAHEVWENLWMDTAGPEKRFYQGLIQAAVGLYHFGNGNVGGATKLYRSSRDYMLRYGDTFKGLDQVAFWQAMEKCFAPLLGEVPAQRGVSPAEELIPTIVLDPPPEVWPDPEQFLEEDAEEAANDNS